MKVLFIYSLQEIESLDKPLRSQEQIQFGISYISSVLKLNDHQTKLVVLSKASNPKINRHILDSYILDFKPGLICFSAVSSEFAFISGLASYINRRYGDIYLLIGGVHASLNPAVVLGHDFDAVCVGEGEYATLELADFLEKGIRPSGIRNLWITNDDKIEKNEPRPFLEDLDSLPMPDRDIWQEWIRELPESKHAVLLGRGCPYECAYCCNHALKRISSGRYVRLRSVDSIIAEIKELTKKFTSLTEIYLEVETFYIDKIWAHQLCERLTLLNKALNQPLAFGVNLRVTPNANYEELFALCKKSNFRFINIGLESGSERVRRDVLRRNYANDDVINTAKLAKQHGLKVAFFNLIGIPGETLSDFSDTIRINRACLPDWTMTSIFFPYPGTDLYLLCKNAKLLTEFSSIDIERSKAILELPGFSKRDIQNSYDWFYYDVYKANKPVYKLLLAVFIMKLRHFPVLFNFYKSFRRNESYIRLKRKLADFYKKTDYAKI